MCNDCGATLCMCDDEIKMTEVMYSGKHNEFILREFGKWGLLAIEHDDDFDYNLIDDNDIREADLHYLGKL